MTWPPPGDLLAYKTITPCHLYPTREPLVRGLIVLWCYGVIGGRQRQQRALRSRSIFFGMCAGLRRFYSRLSKLRESYMGFF
jgi:hypothetical protein